MSCNSIYNINRTSTAWPQYGWNWGCSNCGWNNWNNWNSCNNWSNWNNWAGRSACCNDSWNWSNRSCCSNCSCCNNA